MKILESNQAAHDKISAITKFVFDTLESSDNGYVDVFFKGEDDEAENIHQKWLSAIKELEGMLSELVNNWPELSGFASSTRKYLGFYRARIDFYPAWRSFVKDYVDNPGNLKKQRDFVLRNRELNTKGWAELEKADKQLERLGFRIQKFSK